jgi:hypothetical protein
MTEPRTAAVEALDSDLAEPADSDLPETADPRYGEPADTGDGTAETYADSGAADSRDDDVDLDTDLWPERGLGAGMLLVFALAWLAATMWGTKVMAEQGLLSVTIATIAEALPSVMGAGIIGGAAAGLAARLWLARDAGTARRVAVTVGASVVVALVAGAVVPMRYGTSNVIWALAGTIAVACLLGGVAALVRPPVVAGALAATLSAFVVASVLYNYQSQLKHLLGSGSTPAAELAAANRFSYLTGAVSGVVAGVVAYYFLRRRGLGWPSFLVAGGSAGVVLLVSQGLTQLGGATLLRAASGLSEADRIVRSYLDAAGLDNALIVGFVGAFVAMVAFGRTLRSNRQDWEDEPAAAEGDGSGLASGDGSGLASGDESGFARGESGVAGGDESGFTAGDEAQS